jgi:hypothetical protein
MHVLFDGRLKCMSPKIYKTYKKMQTNATKHTSKNNDHQGRVILYERGHLYVRRN